MPGMPDIAAYTKYLKDITAYFNLAEKIEDVAKLQKEISAQFTINDWIKANYLKWKLTLKGKQHIEKHWLDDKGGWWPGETVDNILTETWHQVCELRMYDLKYDHGTKKVTKDIRKTPRKTMRLWICDGSPHFKVVLHWDEDTIVVIYNTKKHPKKDHDVYDTLDDVAVITQEKEHKKADTWSVELKGLGLGSGPKVVQTKVLLTRSDADDNP